MTTATGEFAFNFAAQGDQNPFSNSNFTKLLAGDAQISGGLLRQAGFAPYLAAFTGGTYDGGPVTTAIEVSASAQDDEVLLGALDQSGDGFLLMVRPTLVIVLVYTAYSVVDSNGSAAITLASDDLFTFSVTKGSPNSYGVTRNGAPISLSSTSYSKTLGNLRSVLGHNTGNIGASAIKSFAVVDGLNASDTVVSPSVGTLSFQSHQALLNPFNSVRIREVLINEAGSPLGSLSGINLLVWYSGLHVGAPDLSYSALTTDTNGTVSWSIATGSLRYGDTIAFLAHGGGTPATSFSAGRITPRYES